MNHRNNYAKCYHRSTKDLQTFKICTFLEIDFLKTSRIQIKSQNYARTFYFIDKIN